MELVPRPQPVHWITDEPAFLRRLLDRFEALLGIQEDETGCILSLKTAGPIPSELLDQLLVVRIAPGESLATHVQSVQTADGMCRLTLRSWLGFLNHDPLSPPLAPGLHLWLGAAWRHVPTAA